MKILALDSSAKIATVALCDNEKILYLTRELAGNRHSESLLPLIKAALDSQNMTVADVDLFACAVGPGSYTGIRIGVATVKGLASGSGKPCVPVSTLHALARNCEGFEGLICPVMDARRDNFFSSLFEENKTGLHRITKDAHISLEELDKQLKNLNRTVYFVGDGSDKAIEGVTFRKIKRLPPLLRSANAYSVAMVALETYMKNPMEDYDESKLLPVYLRLSQAEQERKERLEREQKEQEPSENS